MQKQLEQAEQLNILLRNDIHVNAAEAQKQFNDFIAIFNEEKRVQKKQREQFE